MRSIVELKEKNLLDILRVIQIHGPISKPNVAARSKVSAVTAHNFIIELEKAGLVAINGTARSNGGRKAALYSTNRDYGYIVGLSHGRSAISTGVYDLSLNTVYLNRVRSDLAKSLTEIDKMKAEIRAAIVNSGVPAEKILGIGITLPGRVNHRDGVVIGMLNLPEWENTPLQSIMERFFGLPVCVYNDNRASIVSCKWQNKIAEGINAAYINIASGVGAGVMIGGEVFSGSHSFAGEVGHITVPGKRIKCQCGKEGCIETLISSAHVIKQIKKRFGASAVRGVSTGACEEEIVRLARTNGDAYGIVKEAVKNFIYVIDAVIKTYDPEKIIIYNAWLLNFNELYDELVENVFKNCKWLRKNTLTIELDAHDVNDGYGPAAVILENLLNYNSENRIVLKMN